MIGEYVLLFAKGITLNSNTDQELTMHQELSQPLASVCPLGAGGKNCSYCFLQEEKAISER
jgi:hypothetical protein